MPFWRAQTFLMQMDFLPITGLQNILQSAPFMLFLVYYPKVSECNAKNVLIEMQIRFLKFAIKSRTFLPLVEPQTIARGEIFLIATFSTLKKMKIRFARYRLAWSLNYCECEDISIHHEILCLMQKKSGDYIGASKEGSVNAKMPSFHDFYHY